MSIIFHTPYSKKREVAWLLEEKYHGEKTEGFFADCAQLENGEPLAYLIGHVPFLDCTIWLDSHPLIPRPETEFWIASAIKEITASMSRHRLDITNPLLEQHFDNTETPSGDVTSSPQRLHSERGPERDASPDGVSNSSIRNVEKSDTSSDGVMSPPQQQSSERGLGRSTLSDDVRKKNVRILDLCAGSGCIGVAVAKAIPEAYIDFAEIEVGHHETILKNIKENGIAENRCAIFGGDLFAEIPPHTRYDFILSNPPYIDYTLAYRTEESVIAHEPSLALWGGKDGLEVIYTIIEQAPYFLATHGTLYIEHEPEQTQAIAAHAEKYGFTTTSLEDQYQLIRTSQLVRKLTSVAK